MHDTPVLQADEFVVKGRDLRFHHVVESRVDLDLNTPEHRWLCLINLPEPLSLMGISAELDEQHSKVASSRKKMFSSSGLRLKIVGNAYHLHAPTNIVPLT